MAVRVTQFGEIEYNGVPFGIKTTYSVVASPTRDSSERTVAYVHHSINLESYFTKDEHGGNDGVAADTVFKNYRRLLSQDSGILKFNKLGYGILTVNDPAVGLYDVRWGPKVSNFRWEALGGNIAARVTLTIDTWVPECLDPQTTGQQLIEFNYTTNYRITPSGMTNRTISGHALLPGTLARSGGAQRSPDHADRLREQIQSNFVIPTCMQREWSFSTNEAKDQIDFTATDTQIESFNPYIKGSYELDGDMTVAANEPPFINSIITFSFSAKCREGYPRGVILSDIYNMARLRIGTLNAQANTKAILVLAQQHKEALFGRGLSYSLSIMVHGQGNLGFGNIPRDAGMFQSFPGILDWTAYRDSMIPAWDVRGFKRIIETEDDHDISTLCNNQSLFFSPDPGIDCEDPPISGDQINIGLPEPAAKDSWIMYSGKVHHGRRENTVRHRTIQERTSQGAGQIDPQNWLDWNNDSQSTQSRLMGNPDGNPDIIQQRGVPSYDVALSGWGMRCGHPISVPAIEQYSGQPVGELRRIDGARVVNTVLFEAPVSNYADGGIATRVIPVYASAWWIPYKAESAYGDVKYPPNHASDVSNVNFGNNPFELQG